MMRSVKHTVTFLFLLTTVIMMAAPAVAHAWANGPDSGNGFGTHDWVLAQADRLARARGADWLSLPVALLKTDDPDTRLRDQRNHNYDAWGKKYGTAPSRIASLYERALLLRTAGDTAGASEALGLLSHYYADICNPLNTDQAPNEARLARILRTRFNALTNGPKENASWVRNDGRPAAASVVIATRRAASSAHESLPRLVGALTQDGFSTTALRIGRMCLNRAANDLADIIIRLDAAALRNVRAYGAKGDGSTNDTAAVKAALSAAAAAGTGVYLPAGTYKVSTLTIPNGLVVKGDGLEASWLMGGVRFGSHQLFSDLKLGTGGQTTAPGSVSTSTTFERCRFRGGGAGPVIFFTQYSCDHITFRDCLVERNLGVENSAHTRGFNNISLNENARPGGAHFESISFQRCHVGVSNGAGGHDTGSPRMGFEATNKSSTGEVTHGYRDLEFIGCTFEATDETTLDFDDKLDTSRRWASGIRIEGCTIKGGGYADPCYWGNTIVLEAPNNVVIKDNLIYRARTYTLATSFGAASGSTITGNTFDLTVDNGIAPKVAQFGHYISLRGKHGESFTDNVVRAPSVRQLLVFDQCRNTVVSGNQFYDVKTSNNFSTVKFWNAAFNTFKGNYLWSAGAAPTIVQGSDSHDNTVSGNTLAQK